MKRGAKGWAFFRKAGHSALPDYAALSSTTTTRNSLGRLVEVASSLGCGTASGAPISSRKSPHRVQLHVDALHPIVDRDNYFRPDQVHHLRDPGDIESADASGGDEEHVCTAQVLGHVPSSGVRVRHRVAVV